MGTIRGTESASAPEPVAEMAAASVVPTAEPVEFEQVPLPGADPDRSPRTAEKVGAQLKRQTDYYVRQLEGRGTIWMTDQEAKQWLKDLDVVRACLREEEHRLFARGGATEDGLYAEVIERIVGKRAKPAYLGEEFTELEKLFDPECQVIEELLDEPADYEAADSVEQEEPEAESEGDKRAARRAAKPTRKRAKIAVARARCFDRHPEWRQELASRFS